jgi:hypothetical protein
MTNVRNVLNSSDIHAVSDVQQEVLGKIATTADGRVYRYSRIGGDVVPGDKVIAQKSNKSGNAEAASAGMSIIKIAATFTADEVVKFTDAVATIANVQYLVQGVNTNGYISLADALDFDVPANTPVSIDSNAFNGVVKGATGNEALGVMEVKAKAGDYTWIRAGGGKIA